MFVSDFAIRRPIVTVVGWTKVFGTKEGFPLKVWSPSGGGVAMEVLSVERGAVSADMFEIPEGYMDLGAMMGRRGGGGR